MTKALRVASQTVEQLQDDLDKERLQNQLLKNEWRAHAHNKVLIQRQEMYTKHMQKLQLLIGQREKERLQYHRLKDEAHSKIVAEFESKIHLNEKTVYELEEDKQELTQKVHLLRNQVEEYEESMEKISSNEYDRQALERKAEMTVDERFKSKHEAIKSYFDSNITKLLVSQGGVDKGLALGREICSLKLVIHNLESKLEVVSSEKECLDLNVQHLKEIYQAAEAKNRDLNARIQQLNSKAKQQDISLKLEIEKKKQDNLEIEKQLLKSRQLIEEKSREIICMKEQSYTEELSKLDKYEMGKNVYDDRAEKMSESLQEKMVEMRSQHILELEDLKVQYDLEMSEARKELQR